MPETIDVYRDWLKITETARPLSYYQLLRVKTFEDDAQVIRERYRRMNAHVRKFGTGEYAKQSQDLLNELAKAMLCLTDAQRKREYDASLGREDKGEGRRRSLEEILLANKTIDRQQLEKARNFANAVGLEVRDAVVQQKLAPPEVVMQAYAESQGLPYIDLGDIQISPELIPLVPAPMARQHSCVPVLIDGSQLLMASPNPIDPNVEEELRLRFGLPVRTILCTAAAVNAEIAKHYSRDGVQNNAVAAALAAAAAAKRPASASEPAAAAAAPDQPAAEAGAEPRSPEEMAKRRKLMAMAGFAVTVFLFMFYRVFFTRGLEYNLTTFATMFGLAAVMAGISYVIAYAAKL